MKKEKIGIIGAGVIGAGLAALYIANNYHVVLLASGEPALGRANKNLRDCLQDVVNEGLMPPEYAEAYLANVQITLQYEDFADVDFVLEAVYEQAAIKHEVYRKLEAVVRPDTVIASATSAIDADELAEAFAHKGRFLIAHPWNPAHLIPCVEMVKSAATTQETVDFATRMLTAVGREVILLNKSVPGFIGNRIMHAMYREALHLVEMGVVGPLDIDRMVLSSFGPRFASVGLLEYYESNGFDLHYPLQSYLYPHLSTAQGPQAPMLEHYNKGELGLKSGKGFYDWPQEHIDDFRYRKNKPFFQFFKFEEPDGKA